MPPAIGGGLAIGGGEALGATALRVGAAVLAALPVVAILAVAALFVAALVEEVRFARFVAILEANGFAVLLNPLGACIGGLCHSPASLTHELTEPTIETPAQPPFWERPPPPLPRGWVEPTTEAPITPSKTQPIDPFPVPRLEPRPDEEDKKKERKCGYATGLTPLDPIPLRWFKPRHDSFYPPHLTLQHGYTLDRDDPGETLPDRTPIGVHEQYWPRLGKLVRLFPTARTNGQVWFRRVLADEGFRWTRTLQADHVQDPQWGGPDDREGGNYWPLETSTNLSAGSTQNVHQKVTFCPSIDAIPVVDWPIGAVKQAGYIRFFTIQEVNLVSDNEPGLTTVRYPPRF